MTQCDGQIASGALTKILHVAILWSAHPQTSNAGSNAPNLHVADKQASPQASHWQPGHRQTCSHLQLLQSRSICIAQGCLWRGGGALVDKHRDREVIGVGC